MAKTLSQRVPKREPIQKAANAAVDWAARRTEIRAAVGAVEDGALRLGLPHRLPTIRAIGQVWLAHPDGPLPYPAQETLAGRVGRTARTVRRHVAALERAGLLAVYRTCARPLGLGGRLVRRSNRYQFRSRLAVGLRACPLPRRRRLRLEDTDVPRPLERGAVPAPPPSRPAAEAPQVVDPPPEKPAEGVVDGRQALAEVRAILTRARRSTK